MQYRQKGFTLIELLVVIAIIGILATIVLTSLGSARSQATDAKAQAQLASMRAQAQMYYNEFGDYGTSSTAFTPSTGLDCTGAQGSLFQEATEQGLYRLLSTLPAGYTKTCYTEPGGDIGLGNATAWAVTVSNNVNASWCVDSAGNSKAYGSATPADVELAVCGE